MDWVLVGDRADDLMGAPDTLTLVGDKAGITPSFKSDDDALSQALEPTEERRWLYFGQYHN